MDNAKRLSALHGELRSRGFVTDGLQPQALRNLAIQGKFPAHQRNFIWHFLEDDIEEIAAGLRLTKRVDVDA